MNFDTLEIKLQQLASRPDANTFLYDLLIAYEHPEASVTRLKKGDYNLATTRDEVLWKKKVFFKRNPAGDLHHVIDEAAIDNSIAKHHPRFLIVTDFTTLLSIDTKTRDTLDIRLLDLPKHYDFFLPWTGLERADLRRENPADIKAAERMGRLYDLILEINPTSSDSDRHALNLFLSRLLFCFFAEDTGIFQDGQFVNALASHTSEDGTDLQAYLAKLFAVLNLEDRRSLPDFLTAFPYVNGGLFADVSPVPRFNARSRRLILECGSLNWKSINPDIFGSMIQAVVHTDKRSSLGIHYTSVVNIMKVIEPLFLSDLHNELERAGTHTTKLTALLARLHHLRIFDPACGCGNFLVVAYKELCKLEIQVLQRLYGKQLSIRVTNNVHTSQFYGIELDDFAQQTARLALWLAEHQMNTAFKEVFGRARPTLPLKGGGNITRGNATRLAWETICPKAAAHDVFILGNPPYIGARNQHENQKSDLAHVFEGHADYKDCDYVCCWFLRASEYIYGTSASSAFVATNSITQGEQVGHLWPRVLSRAEIAFAHQSFRWTNNARANAGVTCVVIGLRAPTKKPKLLFSGSQSRVVSNISPYLEPGSNTIVYPATRSLSRRPRMMSGSMPRDGGHLLLTTEAAKALLLESPEARSLLRDFMGTDEFLGSAPRKCLWIEDDTLALARGIPLIRARIDKVRGFREASRAKTTRQYGLIPHKFAQRSHRPGDAIIVPKTSSELRHYIPSGFVDEHTVISDLAFAIYDPTPWLFALLSSRMHMTWIRTVAGRNNTSIRYSSSICYNTFPFPETTATQQSSLEQHTFQVLEEREKHPEKTIAELYDPETMPRGLHDAHRALDLVVDRCYRARAFKDDGDRVQHLLLKYEELASETIAKEAANA
jgi:hypothetical protein